MKKFIITATRTNGTEITEHIYAPDEKTAKRDFHEIYRHAECKITSVTDLGGDFQASKKQEYEAIAQIRAILESLGEGSYTGTALEGCLEVAEDNIKNDFGNSYKDACDRYAEELNQAKKEICAANVKIASLEQTIRELEYVAKEAKAAAITNDDLETISTIIKREKDAATKAMRESAIAIVENADDTNSNAFQRAVTQNRYNKSIAEQLTQLEIRVNASRHQKSCDTGYTVRKE